MEKINISELLKDCPTGYPLDCTMYEDVYFDFVDELNIIHCYIQYETHKTSITFNQYGTPHNDIKSKCVIFPKGKTTWEGFVPPRQFKDGDILFVEATYDWIVIYKENENQDDLYKYVATPNYANYTYIVYDNNPLCYRKDATKIRFATEEEKAKLFKAIKDRGYKWNSKTKTLEILIEPNFKVGDWVTDGVSKCQIYFIDDTHYWYSANCILGSLESVDKQYHLWTINDAKDGDVLFHSDSASNGIFIFKEILQRGTLQKVICYCDYDSEDGFCLGENHTCCWADSKILRPASEERRNRLFQKMREAGYKWNAETKTLDKLIKPKFKVGDRVKYKDGKNIEGVKQGVILSITDDTYDVAVTNDIGIFVPIANQDQWELVPNKFDINTLKPFDEVLVRNTNNERWRGQFYMSYDKNEEYPFECTYNCWKQCIPYKGNEFLRGTSDECKDFYKIWE